MHAAFKQRPGGVVSGTRWFGLSLADKAGVGEAGGSALAFSRRVHTIALAMLDEGGGRICRWISTAAFNAADADENSMIAPFPAA